MFFRGFNRVSGVHYVHCPDPYDPRPYVRAAIDRGIELTEKNGKPSVVLFGEEHKTGSNIASIQLAIQYALQAMHRIDKIVVLGLEAPHFPVHEDDDGSFLKYRAEDNAFKHAKHFNQNLYRALCAHASTYLSVFRNDATYDMLEDGTNILGAYHYITIEEMLALGFDPDDHIRVDSPDGVAVRNRVIVRNILDDIESLDIGLYVHQLGAFHLKDVTFRNWGIGKLQSFEGSVETVLLESDRVNVVSAYPSISRSFNYVTAEAKSQNAENTIVATGMNNTMYSGGWYEHQFQDQRRDMRRIHDATQGEYRIY